MKPALDGHTAIISGGLGDIGRAISFELAGRGANIAIGDMHAPEDAAAILDELRQGGVRAVYHQVDVSDAEAVGAWVKAVARDLGSPTLVIPNAATVTQAPALKITPSQWQQELAVNLSGAFYLAQAAARRLVADRQAGRIVFVGSWAAHRPHPTIPAYCAAKAGLRMVVKTMALELASHDILVNEVAPGYVDAGLSGHIFEREPSRRAVAESQAPVKRLIAPQDVAREVAHLCDPATRHTTGSTVLIDSGLSLLSGAMDPA